MFKYYVMTWVISTLGAWLIKITKMLKLKMLKLKKYDMFVGELNFSLRNNHPINTTKNYLEITTPKSFRNYLPK